MGQNQSQKVSSAITRKVVIESQFPVFRGFRNLKVMRINA